MKSKKLDGNWFNIGFVVALSSTYCCSVEKARTKAGSEAAGCNRRLLKDTCCSFLWRGRLFLAIRPRRRKSCSRRIPGDEAMQSAVLVFLAGAALLPYWRRAEWKRKRNWSKLQRSTTTTKWTESTAAMAAAAAAAAAAPPLRYWLVPGATCPANKHKATQSQSLSVELTHNQLASSITLLSRSLTGLSVGEDRSLDWPPIRTNCPLQHHCCCSYHNSPLHHNASFGVANKWDRLRWDNYNVVPHDRPIPLRCCLRCCHVPAVVYRLHKPMTHAPGWWARYLKRRERREAILVFSVTAAASLLPL